MDGLSADLDEIVADDVSREVEGALSGGVALYPRRPKGPSAPWLLTTRRRKTSMETSSGDVGAVPPNSRQRRWWNRYVAIGDSLTEGLGDPLPDGRLRGWATRLAEHLRQVMPNLAAQLPLPPPLRAQLRRSFNIINDVTRDVADHYDALLLEPPAEWATRRRQLLSIDRIHPSA